jgi:hypothetical protein
MDCPAVGLQQPGQMKDPTTCAPPLLMIHVFLPGRWRQPPSNRDETTMMEGPLDSLLLLFPPFLLINETPIDTEGRRAPCDPAGQAADAASPAAFPHMLREGRS